MKNISLLLAILIIVAELVVIWLLKLPEGAPRLGAFGVVVATGVGLYVVSHRKPSA